MRSIVDDARTRGLLERWAPNGVLDIPAFFFWNSGVLEQRSQAGLFRSILYDVLLKHTNLIPVVFPEEWQKVLELLRHEVPVVYENWSLSRLQSCFKHLVENACERLRLCFFIDGLEEYDGDHDEISEYFSELSNAPFVKFCIASRPLLVFKDAFSTCPGLRLQDLTYNDIHRYIEDKLKANERMKLLTKETPKEARELVQEVIYKAEGGFLWVTLVVKSLLKGLSQRDGISELNRRLKTFPSDLEKLYGHMLSSIEPIYMEEASKIFQLHRATQNYTRPSVELIYIALIVDLQRALGTPTEDVQKAMKELVRLVDSTTQTERFDSLIYDSESLYEHLDDKMRTCCGGLIECNWQGSYESDTSQLSYIHRTVKDYLEIEDVWKDLLAHTGPPFQVGFEPYLQLIMSHILILKRRLLRQIFSLREALKIIRDQWHGICICVWAMNMSKSNTQVLLINEFDRVATNLCQKVAKDEEGQLLKNQHWSNHELPATWETDLLLHGCESNLGAIGLN